MLDLPLPLQIIDAEQRGILRATGAPAAPAHVIHALAGFGKSLLLQCLVAMYAAHHSRLLAKERSAEVLLLTLRTRVVRHVFLQGVLHISAMLLEQVIFGGRLPDRLQVAGVLDDDKAHFP